MREGELELVRTMASEAVRAHALRRAAEKRLVAMARHVIRPELIATVGDVTSAVLVAGGLAPEKYAAPRAFQKALGLNLKERSSGKKKGQLCITKRGDSLARKVLYLAVLRLIQSDDVVRAWYLAKVRREGDKRKMLAVVAVMRKVALALWHVGRGSPFDARKLFDVRRLEVVHAPRNRSVMS